MPENLTLRDAITQHCNESMVRALFAERHPSWERSCPELKDIDFVLLGLLRVISAVDSGRHFLQVMEDIQGEHLPCSTYFKSLTSTRRSSMLEAFEQQSHQLHCDTLAAYLKRFPELDEYTVVAADGHFMDHACHTKAGANGNGLCRRLYLCHEPQEWLAEPAFPGDQWNHTTSGNPGSTPFIGATEQAQERTAKASLCLRQGGY